MPILGRSSCENMGLIQRINAIESVSILKKGMSKLKRNFWQLAVVFGCAKFAEYIVGRDVTVESDHKPLEAIMKNPLHVAPLRLQRMLVQLQRFPGINVVYKRGDSLHLADAHCFKEVSSFKLDGREFQSLAPAEAKLFLK